MAMLFQVALAVPTWCSSGKDDCTRALKSCLNRLNRGEKMGILQGHVTGGGTTSQLLHRQTQ